MVDRWETISKEKVFEYSKDLSIENHVIKFYGGPIIERWPWINLPNYVNVIAIDKQGYFLCFKQRKYAVEGCSLAPVGGFLCLNEDPLLGAKRELLEETGYESKNWEKLGDFVVDSCRGAGTANVFLTRDAEKVTEPFSDDLEEQELLFLSRSEVEESLVSGYFKALPWVAAFSLALVFLKRVEG